MSSDEDDMRGLVVSILNSAPCMNIQFIINGLSVMPYGYNYVSTLFAQNAIGVQIADTGDANVNALFTNETKGFSKLTFSSNSAAIATTPAGRATIVHEATHAVLDATHPGVSIARKHNEFAAFLAQTIYGINYGDPDDTGTFLGPEFLLLARKVIVCSQDGVYEIPSSDYDSLETSIVAEYQANAAKQGKLLPEADIMLGIPPAGEPMTPD